MGAKRRDARGNRAAALVKTPFGLPAGYAAFLEDLKARIRGAQVRAATAVSRELIHLYWDIGRAIVFKQRTEGWGKAVVERLSRDIQSAFPGIAGFSPQNVWYMRAFYLAWRDADRILQRPVGDSGSLTLQQAVGELFERIVPQAVGQIPWSHNIQLIAKLRDPAERLWYARQTIGNGWSRNMLVHWIESGLYARQGKAVTNFRATLPPAQSDLAQQLIKDPYNFDFLTLHTNARERELEEGLLDHVTRFLLELGAGFAFVGRQVHLEVDREDFYLDLLFYHLRLRCFVVLDLKTGAFKPEYAGKMNFYVSAVDDRLRHDGDQPSIGLILCKTRSKVIAEYALRHLQRPVGVARYVTKLTGKLPRELAGKLPTIAQIEAELTRKCRTRPGGRKPPRSSRVFPAS